VSSRRLLALLCAALLGLLLAVGLVVGALAGPVAAGAYAVLALALVVIGAVRGRRLLARPASGVGDDGRSCTCCTTSHFDPVTVIE
jgi:hypothetical protein